MYAIIKTGGKQYKVSEGDVITVEKLAANEGGRRFSSSSTRLSPTIAVVRVIVSRSRRLLSRRSRLNR